MDYQYWSCKSWVSVLVLGMSLGLGLGLETAKFLVLVLVLDKQVLNPSLAKFGLDKLSYGVKDISMSWSV